MPKILIVKKGMTGEGVAVERVGREWVLNVPNTALRQPACLTKTPGAQHNQEHTCACLACAHLVVFTCSRKEDGVGGGVIQEKRRWPSPRAELAGPSLGQETARALTGPRSETAACRGKDTGAVPTYLPTTRTCTLSGRA